MEGKKQNPLLTNIFGENIPTGLNYLCIIWMNYYISSMINDNNVFTERLNQVIFFFFFFFFKIFKEITRPLSILGCRRELKFQSPHINKKKCESNYWAPKNNESWSENNKLCELISGLYFDLCPHYFYYYFFFIRSL
jgi:hypothetical protein